MFRTLSCLLVEKEMKIVENISYNTSFKNEKRPRPQLLLALKFTRVGFQLSLAKLWSRFSRLELLKQLLLPDFEFLIRDNETSKTFNSWGKKIVPYLTKHKQNDRGADAMEDQEPQSNQHVDRDKANQRGITFLNLH